MLSTLVSLLPVALAAGSCPTTNNPNCDARIAWLQRHYDDSADSTAYYAERGLTDDSCCNVQRFLSEVEGHCPQVGTECDSTVDRTTTLTTSGSQTYLGCFRTNGDEQWTTIRNILDPDTCAERCGSSPYFALNYHYKCTCLDTKDGWQSADESECSTSCEGDRSIMCGGIDRLSLYSNGGGSPSPNPTTQTPTPAPTNEMPAPSPTPSPADKCDQRDFGSSFQECAGRIDWLVANWQKYPAYAEAGVDGTRCSCQNYLATVENFCPPVGGTTPTPAPAPGPSGGDNEIKIMTYNLWWYRAVGEVPAWAPYMWGQINAENPDVLGLQECDDANRVAGETGMRVAVGNQHGVAILYNPAVVKLISGSTGTYNLNEQDQYGQRIVMHAQFETNDGKRFWHFNTHWCLCGDSQHLGSAITAAAGIQARAGNTPALLTGDLNTAYSTNGKAIRYFKGETVDGNSSPVAFTEVMGSKGLTGPTSIYQTKIDWIFERGFTVKSAQIKSSAVSHNCSSGYPCGSDHYPLTATLQF